MKRLMSLILAIVMLLPGTAIADAVAKEKAQVETKEAVEKIYPKADIEFFKSTLELINKKYPFEVDEDKIIKAGVKGMLQELDPNSDYYTREEAEMFLTLTQGQVVGIGIVMEYKEGLVNVKEVIPNNPAEKAGIKDGDILISIDDNPVMGKSLEEVSKMIKGEKDTEVKITVKREDKLMDFQVKRASVAINPVSFKILEDKIGYFHIEEFSMNTSKYMEAPLKEMKEKNINKIILDLRYNPGGLLNEAVEVADLLLPKGDVVHIRYKDKMETLVAGKDENKYEIIVLVNGGSASASEIVAGTIQDRKLGKLVGTTTYGKGTVQSLLPITDGSLMKLTIAEYLTPKKESIDGIGIEPNIVVENVKEDEDLQLKKAIELLK